jgi:hypothetical protein
MTFFSLTAIIIINTSCSKGKSDDINSSLSHDSVLVSKFILLDSSFNSDNDTSEIIYYKYDVDKRLIESLDIYYNQTGHPDTTSFNKLYSIKKNLYYDNTDTLPHEIITKEVRSAGFIVISIDTSYRSYDLTGRLIKDSVHSYRSISGGIDNGSYSSAVSQYIYKDLFVYIKSVYNSSYTTEDSIIQASANGNIIYQKDLRPVSTSYVLAPTCNFIFDTHPNPMYKNGLNAAPIYGLYNYFGIGIIIENQKNNYISVEKSTPLPSGGSNDVNFKYIYKYRTDGYPVEVVIEEYVPFYNTPFRRRGLYIYN